MLPAAFSCAGPAAALGVPPPVPAAPPPAAPQDALRIAHGLLRRGDMAGALAWLDLTVLDSPDLPVAHLGRAVCLAHLGREDEADVALARALSLPVREGILPLQLAGACARSGHGALAMSLLEVAVAASPAHGERALRDPAFGALRDHPRFLLICGAL